VPVSDAVLRLVPGAGLLSRRPRALLYATTADASLVDAFTGAPEGSELQAVASATVAAGFDVGPFVALSWDEGLRVMAFGDVAVETDQPSLPMLSGAGSRTWVEHTVVADAAVVEVGAEANAATDLVAGTVLAGGFRLELVAAGAPSQAPAAPPPPVEQAATGTGADPTTSVPRMERQATVTEPRADPVVDEALPSEDALDLVDDVEDVAGADVAATQVAPATTSLPAPEPVDIDDSDPVAALAAIQAAAVGPDGEPLETSGAMPPPARPVHTPPPEDHHDPDVTLPPPASEALLADVRLEPAPDGRGSLVDAKLCANGHANPPTAATCAVCAEFLAPGATAIVHVPRPSLGRLQLDDGELLELDQELLVGRNPDRDQDPARAGLRRVKTLGDKVSRSHLEVRFQGWDVFVADCGSTNGTFVVPHPGGQVVALEPGRLQMIDAGAVVYFGSRSFTVLGREESA
jgi:hypothetical protein